MSKQQTQTANQQANPNDIRTWEHGIIQGAKVNEDLKDQLVAAEDLRKAQNFTDFKSALKVYAKASENIFKAHKSQNSMDNPENFSLNESLKKISEEYTRNHNQNMLINGYNYIRYRDKLLPSLATYQATDPNNVKSWANGVIKGAKIPANAQNQLIEARDLKSATTFSQFKNELSIYKKASTYILEADGEGSAFIAKNALAADSADRRAQITKMALEGLDTTMFLSQKTSSRTAIAIIPRLILEEIGSVYTNAEREVNENNYKDYKTRLPAKLSQIPDQITQKMSSVGSSSYNR